MNVGDKAWYVAGYSGEYLIAIHVELQEQDMDGSGWWVDEPVGHSLPEEELYVNRQDAETELRRRISQIEKLDGESEEVPSLEDWREDKKSFIRQGWAEDGGDPKDQLPEYSDKVEGVDWFSILTGRLEETT